MTGLSEKKRGKGTKRKSLVSRIDFVVFFLLIVIAAGYVYSYLLPPAPSSNNLVVYAPQGFMNPSLSVVARNGRRALIDDFQKENGINITYVDDFHNSTVMIEAAASGQVRRPDVYIGIDNLNIIEAKEKQLLEPYESNQLGTIYPWLVESLDPSHHALPYSYLPLALLLDTRERSDLANRSTSLRDLISPELAQTLVVPAPSTTELGRHVLMWEIVTYEKVLKEDWKEWWLRLKPTATVVTTVGKSYDYLLAERLNKSLLLGTATDVVFILQRDSSYEHLATKLPSERGTVYSWVIVYGIAIDRASQNKVLAKKFVDWMLGSTVQQFLAEGSYSYPANSEVALPSSYQKAVNPASFTPLNSLIRHQEIAASFKKWLNEWTTLMKA